MTEDNKIDFGFNLGASSNRDDLVDTTPLRILLIDEFGSAAVSQRPLEVHPDNRDDVMQRLQPRIDITVGESALKLTFRRLEDFHPDHLIQNLEIFAPFCRIRRELLDPATFEQAASTVKSWPIWQADSAAGDQQSEKGGDQAPPAEKMSDIERLLGRKPMSGPAQAKSIADQLIRDIVGPNTTPQIDPQRDDLVAVVDGAIAGILRTILHHPQFQKLEATWRGLDLLLNRLDTGVSIKLFLLNLSPQSWLDEMNDAAHIMQSAFYRMVIEQTTDTHGAEPWALIVLNHPVSLDEKSIIAFQRSLTLARAAQATVVAAADDTLQKAASHPLWENLRQQPEAAMGGLLYGRFMLRRPYGKTTDAIDSTAFEEIIGSPPEPNAYLWGNPAWIFACLFGQAYEEAGWNLRSSIRDTLDDIPTHCFKLGDRVEQQHCTFPTLAESDVATLIQLGLMPVFSFRGQELVRIARQQSLAQTPTPLQGRW